MEGEKTHSDKQREHRNIQKKPYISPKLIKLAALEEMTEGKPAQS